MPDPVQSLITSSHFGFVGEEAFRHWQPVNHVSLEALVRAELGNDDQRERKVAAALELYADYGRGADGMQLPWLTTCYRATVLESFWTSPRAVDEPTVPIALAVAAAADTHGDSPADPTPQSTDSGASYDLDGATPGQRVPSDDLLLIDFR